MTPTTSRDVLSALVADAEVRSTVQPPTVLLCGPSLSAMGGGPTHLRNLLASPLALRYRFIHFETGSRGVESPANEEGTPAKIWRLVSSPLLLAWTISRVRPAVIHLNSAMDHRAFWRDAIYLIIGKLLRCKVAFQVHGGWPNLVVRGPCSEIAARWVLRWADAIVLLSEAERVEYRRLRFGKRVCVIQNAIDVAEYRASVRVHSGRLRRFAYLGRIFREKGVFEAIRAIELLRAKPGFEDVELRIAGTGPGTDEVKRYINEHRLTHHVKLVGAVFGAEKVRFLRDADAFLFPSYHTEGLPYSVLESLAAGTPVIASRLAGIPDVVMDGVHGVLISPRNPSEIVRAVELLSDPSRLAAMSQACVQWASEQLGLERLSVQFDALYEEMLAGKN